MVDSLRLFAAEVTRVAKEVGIDGQLGGQAYVVNGQFLTFSSIQEGGNTYANVIR